MRIPTQRLDFEQRLTQDRFLKLYLKMTKGDPIENPRAWLYRVAHNLALRSHKREPRFDELDPNCASADTRPQAELALSLNLHRRHLVESQRALVAARLAKLMEVEAVKRRAGAGRKTLQICRELLRGNRG